MDILAIRALTDEQLSAELDSIYRELMNVRFRLSTRQLNNPQELRNVRKTIARVKTVMHQRRIAER
ncbi:MAG: 50S ribosomal protein L29 [Dehalococcoidia bacterium]|nr:50S ribosomal protein L29 [Dehalococcoidia bacterium]